MDDRDCVRFLQQTLPRLQLRWRGFRRVRRQVCRRLQQRLRELELPDLATYQQHLELHPPEWDRLDACCRITISRFYRDHGMFRLLEHEALPQLAGQARASGRPQLDIWSAGCGAGEEPYSLAILWAHSPEAALRETPAAITATDADPVMLQRAGRACYPFSSIRGLPPDWRDAAFNLANAEYCLRRRYRQPVRFMAQDIRHAAPGGPFDLVLCRNLAFTYFADDLQRATAARIASVLRPGGLLVLGEHERLPRGQDGFTPWRAGPPLYRRLPSQALTYTL
jgi:chemotaxis protein methyltransferase CheR